MRKIFFIYILILIACSSILFEDIVFAQRVPEVTYPVIVPGVTPPTGQTDIGGYIRYLYVSFIALGGLLTLGALIYGGFRFLTSVGKPEAMADARERILYGIIGLLILFGSFVLLREINPQLVSPFIPSLTPTGVGIIVYSDQNCGNGANGLPGVLQPLPPDVRYERVEMVKKLSSESISIQSFWTFEDDSEILIEFYNNSECEGAPLRRIPAPAFDANRCVNGFGVIQPVRCIKLLWHTPGVYLFSDTGIRLEQVGPGTSRMLLRNSAGSLPAGINDDVRTLALSSNSETGILYGAILHRNPGAPNQERGWSTIFLPHPYQSPAGTVSNNVVVDNQLNVTYYDNPRWEDASAVTVFQIAREVSEEWWIRICRNINCEPEDGCPGIIEFYPWQNRWRRANYQQIGDEWVLNWDEEHTADFTIQGLDPEIVRGINLFEDTDGFWCADGYDNTKHLRIQQISTVTEFTEPEMRPNGVSAIEIHPSAQYIITLHHRREAGNNAAVTHDPSLVTSAGISALNTVQFDNIMGAIRVIRGKIQ